MSGEMYMEIHEREYIVHSHISACWRTWPGESALGQDKRQWVVLACKKRFGDCGKSHACRGWLSLVKREGKIESSNQTCLARIHSTGTTQ